MNGIASNLRRFAGLCCFGAALVALSGSVSHAIEIVPATAQDILKALGPDSQGLALSEESLPDMFALTASRIEENSKAFIVEEPYESGRWLGGKVVIEYARDLSYTLVSVYDKHGHRERIYSVRTKYTEHMKHQEAKAQAQTPDLVEVDAEEFPPAKSAQTASPSSSRTSKRSSTRSVSVVASAFPPSSSSRKSAAEPAESAGGGSGVRYEWNEEQGTYMPVGGGGAPAESSAVDQMPEPETPPEAVERESESSSKSSSKRRKKSSPGETKVASAKTKSSASSPSESAPTSSSVWIPPAPAKSVSAPTPLEDAEQVRVNNTTWVERGAQKPAEETPAPKRRKRRHEEAKPTPAAAVSPQVASKPAVQSKADDEWVPKSVQEATPAEDLAQESPRKSRRHRKRETPDVVDADNELPERGQKKAVVVASNPKAAPPAPESEPAVVAAPHPTPTSSKGASDEVPSTEDLLASDDSKPAKGPDTSEGDKWVPKAASKPAPVPEPVAAPEPVKVASIPKSAPVDNSVENILKMAEQGKGGMPRESDSWEPKKTTAPKSDVDINKELARIRAEESKRAAPKPVPKVRRDVNNPEEGVLPVSSFEKFSGPLYGRHREYERRFYPAKKTNVKVPDHDFYVDEVDRKKEIHNVYYYKHLTGKAPKLVAVDRHEKVSFKGNYDIDKEDKGKISTYN